MACYQCGGLIESEAVSARQVRHASYICDCLRCDVCGGVYGAAIESDEWNAEQLAQHRKEACTGGNSIHAD